MTDDNTVDKNAGDVTLSAGHAELSVSSATGIVTQMSESGVATLTLARPKVHNAFDDVLIEHFTAELKRLDQDRDCRVVVLAAAGESFSAGADLRWMRRMADYTEQENLQDARQLAGLLGVLNGLRKPTVARVQGAAFGGGVGLVACCDIVIASEKASFCLSEVKLGLIPATISPYVIRAIGQRQARRYFLTAERFDAREALRLGLVHKVVGVDDLDERVEKCSRLLMANGPLALAAAKTLIHDVSNAPVDDAMLESTARRIAALRISDEGQEGLDAFLNKRKPDWIVDL